MDQEKREMNEALKLEIGEYIAAMTPEEKKQLSVNMCAAVDKLSKAIVANADEIWANRPQAL